MYNDNRKLAYSIVYPFLVHKKCYINNNNLNICVFFYLENFLKYMFPDILYISKNFSKTFICHKNNINTI